MSLFTKYLGFDKKIEEIEEKHKNELVQLENAYLGEMEGMRESLGSELAAEVEGWYGLGKTERELEDIDRKTLLEQCWNAFCKSPLCRAIVKYTTIFVFGKGITYEIDNPEAKAFVDKFYEKHRLDQQQKKLSNELQIYGELFLYTPESKMVTKEDLAEAAESKEKEKQAIIREAVNDATTEHPEVFDFIPIDPAEIEEIETEEYDIRKVKRYKRVYTTAKGVQVTDWIPGSEIQHIAINCASNGKRGRSDLESVMLNERRLKVRKGKFGDSSSQLVEKEATLDSQKRYLGARAQVNGKGEVLFIGWNGQRILARQISRYLKDYAHRAGVKKNVHAHTFRHSFGTELYRQTKDLRMVQRALRHKRLATTEIYTHIVLDDVKAGLRKADL